VGVVFSLGWSFADVPASMRQAADAHGFPLIAVPQDVKFITLVERLYVELVNEQFALKERADDIHRRLTQLVLEGGGLDGLAVTLADILGRSVLFESLSFEIMAAAQRGPVDENRRLALAAGRTPPEEVARMQARGIYAELEHTLRPIRLEAMPDLGMTMERVVAPIIIGREVYGYIWVVAGDHPLTALDELAIDDAATVAALVLLKEQAVREARQAVRGDFLAQLLRPDLGPEGLRDSALLERAHLVGYHLEKPHQVLCLLPPAATGAGVDNLGMRLERWLRAQGVWSLVVNRERGLAVVLEAKTDTAGQALAERLLAEVALPGQPLVIGAGRAYPAAPDLRRSYAEAREAAEIGARLGKPPRLVCFWKLGVLDWLYHLPPEVLAGNPYLATVQVLAEHDRRTNGDLVRTLDAYLQHGGALAEAAATLTVHRNTLLYRIGRIEEITHLDLKDMDQRFNLHVALKAHLLRR
ncbi:MAG: helix-turn-helix domain-containing protein, partial [Anaerolineales bacterium]|nr:helix-turn-helix domain-containing protein [Anaerolineales bacterium]